MAVGSGLALGPRTAAGRRVATLRVVRGWCDSIRRVHVEHIADVPADVARESHLEVAAGAPLSLRALATALGIEPARLKTILALHLHRASQPQIARVDVGVYVAVSPTEVAA